MGRRQKPLTPREIAAFLQDVQRPKLISPAQRLDMDLYVASLREDREAMMRLMHMKAHELDLIEDDG